MSECDRTTSTASYTHGMNTLSISKNDFGWEQNVWKDVESVSTSSERENYQVHSINSFSSPFSLRQECLNFNEMIYFNLSKQKLWFLQEIRASIKRNVRWIQQQRATKYERNLEFHTFTADFHIMCHTNSNILLLVYVMLYNINLL